MKHAIAAMLLTGAISTGLVGCTDTATAKKETTITTPGGSTTITTEQKVKTTGDHPPAANP